MRSRAESELAASEALAAYARAIAPFDGTVARRFVEPGSVVMPGSPLLVVEDVSRYRMEVTLNASSAGLIGRGSEARLRVDALPGREFRGRVVELETAGDPGSQTLRARIDLPADAALRSGWFGRAWFRLEDKQAVTVPRTSVVARGQLRGVYALDVHQVARFRLVSLGREVNDRVEVLAGLAPGDRILLAPGPRAVEGLKVEAP
jgi:RND family efflux transporter MFP subunit